MTCESSTTTVGSFRGLAYRSCLHVQVLIHAGTGGVGLAAVSVATAAGCRLLCTAGSRQKRSYLRALGVRDVANSRDAAFADAWSCCLPAGVPLCARFDRSVLLCVMLTMRESARITSGLCNPCNPIVDCRVTHYCLW